MASESKIESGKYELVTAMTPDLVKLHGLFRTGEMEIRPREPQTQLDAAVVLHGLGGNFYSSSLNLRLADALNELGVATVLVNTRGHDGISMSPVAGRAQTIGAAHEIVDDCRNDVTGWVDWLAKRKNYSRIGLVGHSLGAIKALYAQAYSAHASVKAIVGLSATRLCHENFLESAGREDFMKWYGRASELVEQGRGDELLLVEFPFPTPMRAEAYVDKYGPANRYDWIRFADRINVPTLLMFGERELSDNPAFHGLWQQAIAATESSPNFDLQVISSANHFYAGVHDRATTAMQTWLTGSS